MTTKLEFPPGFRAISGYPGRWQVLQGPRGWYVGRLGYRQVKFVGPVRISGRNYCDEARVLAQARNAAEHF